MSLLKRVERAQQLADDPTAEAPVVAPPPLPPSAARIAAREELLLAIRLRLQDEVMGSFDTLLDLTDETELLGRVEAIVDRVIRVQAYALDP